MMRLECGIELPDPPRKSGVMLWDYELCLRNLPDVLGKTMPEVVGYLHMDNNIALRFIGEMEIAGYVRFERRYRGTTTSNREVSMTDTVIKPTAKLNKVPVHAFVHEPKEPVTTLRGNMNTEVRRGVDRWNPHFKQNKESYAVVKDMVRQPFKINTFMLDVLREYPALHSDEDGYIMYKRCINYAHKFKDVDQFFFPQFLCNRGREYDATTVGFSPQGADHEKALLLHTYEEVLNKDGYNALIEAIDGYSEQDWDVETILYHAANWELTYGEWSKADKPYSYIAHAKLLLDYAENPEKPIPAFTPLDGRCSGLQHWSAMTRSTAITNRLGMEPEEAEDGRDIYEHVGYEWELTLPEDQKQYASRKAAKIPTMTWGYNATRMTSIEHMTELFGEKSEWKDGEWQVIKAGLPRADTAALGSDLYNRLHETLNDLSEAVRWVGECARMISANRSALRINWTTPDGFVGEQKKVVMEEFVVRITLSDGRDLTVQLRRETRKPDSRRHANGLAPQIIHSFDATHLRMVARELVNRGLPMIFIHDSFATHSNYRNDLYDIIVNTFIEMYSTDHLQRLKEEWESTYEIKLEEPPKMGDWDVENLRNCPRFFA